MNQNAKYKKYFAALAASTAMISSASAATITWGGATNITSTADIITGGLSLVAGNGGNDTVTISGLSFQGTTTSAAFGPITSTPAFYSYAISTGNTGSFAQTDADTYGVATGSTELDTVLATHSFGVSQNTTATITLNNLSVGATYTIQYVGAADDRASTAGRTSTLDGQTALVRGPAAQFSLGTFTADATTQDIVSVGSAGGSGEFSALVLRQDTAPVPEPSSTALLGLGGLALILRRRK